MSWAEDMGFDGYDVDDYEEESEVVKFTKIEAETEKAWLFLIHKKKYWFPKSQCEIEGNELYIPTWLWLKRKEVKNEA